MRRKPTRVVPRLVLGASFIAVVPACALAGCGGSIITGDGGTSDANNDHIVYGVAAVAYCCFDAMMGVADAAFKGQ